MCGMAAQKHLFQHSQCNIRKNSNRVATVQMALGPQVPIIGLENKIRNISVDPKEFSEVDDFRKFQR